MGDTLVGCWTRSDVVVVGVTDGYTSSKSCTAVPAVMDTRIVIAHDRMTLVMLAIHYGGPEVS